MTTIEQAVAVEETPRTRRLRALRKRSYDWPGESLRKRAFRVYEARDWPHKVMALVGTWWFSEPDGVPSARTLRYGSIYSRSQHKGSSATFATYGDAPESGPDQEVSVSVFASNNDGFELWLGTTHQWHTHLDPREVRLLLWYLIFEWYGRARWFGLRRRIYYRALHSAVSRYKVIP